MILRLGSGEAAAWGCGAKAALLDRASRQGLPVPSGMIIPHEALSEALGRGLARIVGERGPRSLAIPAPAALMSFLGLDTLSGRLAVRSAFSANIKERRDCSTALFDEHGRMVTQAEHIPVHLGAMPEAVAAVRLD